MLTYLIFCLDPLPELLCLLDNLFWGQFLFRLSLQGRSVCEPSWFYGCQKLVQANQVLIRLLQVLVLQLCSLSCE